MGSIFHGTTEALAQAALTEGIKPREDRDEQTVHIHYGYAPFEASIAGENTEKWAIIDILESSIGIATPPNMPLETYLDEELLLTGENPLDLGPEDLIDQPEEDRMAYFRDNILDYGSLWNDCSVKFGGLGYAATIEPVNIQRIAVFDPTVNTVIAAAVKQMVVSSKNYAQLDATAALLTSWFFEPVTPLTVEEFFGPLREPQLSSLSKSEFGAVAAALRDYSALEQIFP